MADEKKGRIRGYLPRKVTRPKGGKRASRAYALKQRAAERIVVLLKYGERADRLACPAAEVTHGVDRRALREQERFARLPRTTQIYVLSVRRAEIVAEIEVAKRGSELKRTLILPTATRQLEEIDALAKELMEG